MLISATRRREAEAIVDRVRYIELTAHPGFSDIYMSAIALVGDPVSTSVHRQDLPIVGITLGDVAGIGPEVVVRALARDDVKASCRPLVIGDRRVLEEPRFAAQGLCFQAVEDISQADWSAHPVVVLDVHVVDPRDVTVGQISPIAGRAAVQFVLKATALVLEGAIDAVATAPLNKEAMRLAGYDYIGHTEILADVTHTGRVHDDVGDAWATCHSRYTAYPVPQIAASYCRRGRSRYDHGHRRGMRTRVPLTRVWQSPA